MDDIKDTEHVLQIVDQDMLTKTDKSVVMAETYKNSLDVKIGTKAVSNMLNNDDNRTFAHELGHSGRIGAYNECGKLDDTEKSYSRF
ncbi:hypothetical protein NIB75_03600 [Bacteroides uniformis]|nr:hypothetical protein [Bacteroides uniformis]